MGFWQRANDVHMDVVETLCSRFKFGQGGLDMFVYLGALTTDAGSGPLRDLFSQAMPNKLGQHQPFRDPGAWVGQQVDGVKYASVPCLRYYRSCCASGNVTQKCETSIFKRNVLVLSGQNGGNFTKTAAATAAPTAFCTSSAVAMFEFVFEKRRGHHFSELINQLIK